MKDNILEYKGYHTKVEIDMESCTLHGKIEGINDFVNFTCKSLDEVEKEFQMAVDDYLTFCEEIGKQPEKEYKGTFNVRIKPELHKKLAVEAYREGKSLNAMIEQAIQAYFTGNSKSDIQQQTIYNLSKTIENAWKNNEHKNNAFVYGREFTLPANLGNKIRMVYNN